VCIYVFLIWPTRSCDWNVTVIAQVDLLIIDALQPKIHIV